MEKAESPDNLRETIKARYDKDAIVYFGPVTLVSIMKGE